MFKTYKPAFSDNSYRSESKELLSGFEITIALNFLLTFRYKSTKIYSGLVYNLLDMLNAVNKNKFQ